LSSTIRVYVNSKPLDVPPGSTVRDALLAWDPDHAGAVERGERGVTDSRGLPASLGDTLAQGSILRVVGARTTA
jgi:hypothetical protein